MRKHKFVKLYRQYRLPIYRFIFLKVSSREMAEDLTSETFLKSFGYLKKNKAENPKALFYHIARNLVIDYYRKKKPVVLEQDVPHEDKNHLDIQKALSQLKDNYRQAVSLYYIEGYSQQEIAKIMNKTEGAVRNMVYRGLKALRGKV